MFQMRPEQVAAFESAQWRSFEDRAIAHARRTLPDLTADMTDDRLRPRIQREMAKSQSYGLETERQILCFIDSGLMLGEGFDRDPRLPWAREILTDLASKPEDRARTLVRRAASATGREVTR